MKKLILISILLSSTLVFSQEYFPIVQENNEWNVLHVIFPGGNPWDTIFSTQTYKFSGDTIISNKTYKKVVLLPFSWVKI